MSGVVAAKETENAQEKTPLHHIANAIPGGYDVSGTSQLGGDGGLRDSSGVVDLVAMTLPF